MRARARQHPYLGWLHVEQREYQSTMDRMLRYRDLELLTNPSASGMPEKYKDWVQSEELPRLLENPRYRERAQNYVDDLMRKVELIEADVKPIIDSKLKEADELRTQANSIQENIQFAEEGVPYSEP